MLFAATSGTAMANAAVGLAANFPVIATVGATNVPANLDFTNVSTPATLTISVNSITLTPSCAAYSATACTTPDNGVFAISPGGTGRAGTACAGVTFTFTPKPGATDGTLNVLPSAPISLGVPGAPNNGDECVIDFTFNVLKAPDTDGATDPLHPGLQTLPSGIVNGTASDFSTAEGFGTTFITVLAPVSISTTASAGGTVGTTLSDQATLTTGVFPTGTITFNLYGPNDATCASAPVFTSTVAVSGAGTYASGTFAPASAGVYRWRAFYSGDANDEAVAGACNDAGESATITQVTPSIATLASAGGVIGTALSDQATLSGGAAPTGTLTFDLYGPNDATCASAPVFVSAPVTVNGNGVYGSASFAPAVVGTYRWRAFYSGDTNNVAVAGACNDSGESANITQGTPGIVTTASAGGAVGSALSDHASLTGGVAPTGSITFSLYGPNDATCSSTPAFTSTATVNGNGTYASGSYSATAPGTYRWRAAYSGDINNAGVAGACNDAGESATVTKAGPAIVTVASAGGALGGSISDQATLSGGSSPTGTITFNLYGPNDASCSSAAAYTATVTVSGNGSYGSGAFSATTVGTYRWTAAYSGDANNLAAADACNAANESAVITQVHPAIATTASAGGALGTALGDTAALSGGNSPTGTITFTLYGPNDATCSTTAVFTSTVAVSGNGSYPSATFTPTTAGTYRWRAAYGGDTNNAAIAGACNAAGESATINQTTPAIATTASAGGAIGTGLSDNATLSGGSNPTGSITFTLYGPGDTTCSSTPVFTSTTTVSGNGSYPSATFTSVTAGIYRWRAAYAGDTNNAAVSGACNAAGESATITQTTPAIATTASAGGAIGTALSDVASLTGGTNPTGTITFTLYGPGDATCGNAPVSTSTATVSGNGSYPSASFTPTAAGVYRWRAAYGGDTNNVAVSGACNAANESATITQATPVIATTASAPIKLGGSVNDSATLSAGSNPTGTITFRLYGPNDATCTALVYTSSAVAVSGNGTYASTPAFTPAAVGTYRFIASYSGDTNNQAAAGACGATGESVVVSQATPTIATTASSGGALGTALTDHATLAGGTTPTGTITFTLYGPNDATCSTTPVSTSTASVSGNGSYASGPFTPTVVGTYRWRASYGGDAGNAAVTGACNDAGESATISTVTPTLATTASATIKLGGTVTDTATLAGGTNPTGSITFRLYGPNDASCGTLVFTSSAVTVNGNGSYTSTPAFTPTAVGTYRWVASYDGDANNASVVGACGATGESVVVSQATPAIVTAAGAGGALGAALGDQATLSGAVNPTGTITFTLYGPSDPTCSNAPVFTSSALTVNRNGIYASGAFTSAAAGTYRWRASYSGDANNAPVADACNDPNESATVTGTTPTLDTQTTAAVMLGAAIHDTATLAGGTNPTGTITFSLYGPNDAACSNAAIFTTQASVNGNGSYPSPAFTPTAAGTYRWIASYSGDANDIAISAACNAPNENVVVNVPPVVVTNVPTLSQWTLLLLSLLLGAAGCAQVAVRRR